MNSSLLRVVQKLVLISPLLYTTYLLRFQIAGVPFSILEIFTYFLFGLWILELIRDRKIIKWDRKTAWYWYAAFFVFAGGTLGVLMSPDFLAIPSGELFNAKRVSLGVWKGWVLAPILYFAVLTQVLKTKSDVQKILTVFVYSAALVSLTAYGFGLFGTGVTIDFRLRGFYESANYLALYLVPAILISIYLMLQRQNKKPTKWDYIDLSALVVMVYSLFFTKSYAGIIGLFGSIGLFSVYFLIKNPKQRKKIIGGIVVLFFTFVVVVISQINTSKFKQFLDWENRSSTSVRLEIYKTSIDLIKEKPLIGHGPGLFQPNYQIQAPVTLGHAPLEWNMPHPHNIFLGFWINTGLIGLLAFLLILVLAHQSFTFPLIALWGILIHGLFDMPFWKNDLAMIFWLLIACILVLQKQNSRKSG